MKGLSYVIASILMLIITIALVGTAYMYIAGVFTGAIQGIEITDAYCSLGEVTMTIRNTGTNPITSLEIKQTSPSDDIVAASFSGTIEAGKTAVYKDTCTGLTSRNCIYRITPPQGRTVTASAYCTTIISVTCTYSGSGDWNINCADNCIINTNTNIGTNSIVFTGTGSITVSAEIVAKKLTVGTGCKINIVGGKIIIG